MRVGGGESPKRELVLRNGNQGPIAELELIDEATKENEAVFMTDPNIPAAENEKDLDFTELGNKDLNLAIKPLRTGSQEGEPLNDLE